MSAFRYGNVHLGLLGVLSVTAEQIPGEKNQMPCDGPIDTQFVYSRDGINWTHADRGRTVVADLVVNADATDGQIQVEVCGLDGKVLDGFGSADCIPLTDDVLKWSVKWSVGDIRTIREPVNLRFILNRAKIYSFMFCA